MNQFQKMTPLTPVESNDAHCPDRVILQARGLHKAFGGNVVLTAADLALRQGEVVLLRGENGSGKTTLLNILTGNLEPDAGTIHYFAAGVARTYQFPRQWWQRLNPFDHFKPEFVARQGIGRTWQDIRLFDSHSLIDNVAVAQPAQAGENPFVALLFSGRTRRHEREVGSKAMNGLAALGLAERRDSSAQKISLGQAKRVAIARAVVAGARILFLDEPLAGLDSQGIADVISLLNVLVRKQGITLIIIEHVFNQFHLDGLVTTDWLLEDGKIIHNGIGQSTSYERGPWATDHAPGSPRHVNLLPRPEWFPLLGGPEVEILDDALPDGALLTRIRRASFRNKSPRAILEIRDLAVRHGRRLVIGSENQGKLVGFNLALYEGETAVLQAPNGWGKTTLLMSLAGLIPIAQGSIMLDGLSLNSCKPWNRTDAGLRFVPSQALLFPSLTGFDVCKLAKSTSAKRNEELLARKVGQLSGGQKQSLALASTVPNGRARLFDEPLSGLDARSIRKAVAEHLSATEGCVLIAIPSSTQERSAL